LYTEIKEVDTTTRETTGSKVAKQFGDIRAEISKMINVDLQRLKILELIVTNCHSWLLLRDEHHD